jgi:8-oxo-dGTP pyrophosphatase MutT (NUDIX family)
VKINGESICMAKLITPITEELDAKDWTVTVDGEERKVRHLVIENSKLGILSFGCRPEGTVGWIWEEVSGGAGIIPYAMLEEKLFIGLIVEERQTMKGGQAQNIPRGFREPGATSRETAIREAIEELGFPDVVSRLEDLGGEPANSNSTFFDTSTGGGFRYYGLYILPSELQRVPEVSQADVPVYQFREGLFNPRSTAGERILRCNFFPWDKAATVADTFSNAGTARLLAAKPELRNHL